MPTVAELLADAKTAYHRLLTGAAVVEVRDQNGETIRYQSARKGDLRSYITQLEQQLAGSQSVGPLGFLF